MTARTGDNLTGGLRGENGSEEMDDSDGGREEKRVTGNPSEALLSLFNYHPSLALPITPSHTHTHTVDTHTCAHAVGSCSEVGESLTKGGFVQCGW